MENIWFYDFTFTPLMIVHDVTSVNWKIMWNDIGTFEMHLPIRNDVVTMLNEHPYIVAVQGEKQAIITGWQLKEECALYGRTCNWLLTRRVTPACEEMTDTAENLVRSFVTDAFSDVAELKLEEEQGLENEVCFGVRYDCSTFEAVQSCLEQGNLGHRLWFDVSEKNWVFQIVAGAEKRLVLSENNRTAHESAYEEDILNYYSGGWYQVEQENDDGKESVRTYLKGSEEKTGIYKWDCVLSSDTAAAAEQELKEKKRSQRVTALMRGVAFGRDYAPGDWFCVELVKGGVQRKETKKVLGVYLWYEAEGSGEEPILD